MPIIYNICKSHIVLHLRVLLFYLQEETAEGREEIRPRKSKQDRTWSETLLQGEEKVSSYFCYRYRLMRNS